MKKWIGAVGVALMAWQSVEAVDMKSPQWMSGTPISAEVLDDSTFAVWLKGAEYPMTNANPNIKINLESLLWSTTAQNIALYGLPFGWSKEPGPRHLRLGFTKPVPVETVIVGDGGALSVLKPDAAYPGRLDNDDDWLPAQRLDAQGRVSQAPVPKRNFGIWTLPPNTKTRALRFTHIALPSDDNPEGWLCGALVLSNRFVNVAPYAQVITAENQQHASLLTSMRRLGWQAWANIAISTNATRAILSEAFPEPIILAWQQPVTLDALIGLTTAFAAMEVDTFVGPADVHPRTATEKDWKNVKSFSRINLGYPTALWPNYFPFDQPLTTRAIRLRITEPMPENHDHLRTKTNGGRRFWLEQILALSRLGAKEAVAVPKGLLRAEESLNPPIAIPFTLPEDGYVTLVIEDKDGIRVRNLISETWFPAGENTAWWDGTDDLGRDLDASRHGLYNIPIRPVEPGAYSARGLWHKGTKLFYEFSVYSPGNPPWDTPDHTGAWLANHSQPSSAAFVPADRSPFGAPAIYLGSPITEGPDSVAWLDMDGNKRGGDSYISGAYAGAAYLACDVGTDPDPETSIYLGRGLTPAYSDHKYTELHLLQQDRKSRKFRDILKLQISEVTEPNEMRAMRGIAVYNQKIACAITCRDEIWIVDAPSGSVEAEIPIDAPAGIAYAPDGKLYAVTGKQVVEVAADGALYVVISEGLEEPGSLTIDSKGNFYVSDHGNSHQLKIFSPAGKFVRAIGNPGKPKAGPYDELHMNNPWQSAVDSEGRIWVAEHDFIPKRVSVWSPEGQLLRTFVGPGKYGGGGQIDSTSPNRFYYAEGGGTMEFSIDWEAGKEKLVNILFRDETFVFPFRIKGPETAYRVKGKRYFSNCYNSGEVTGTGAWIFEDRDGIAVPIAGMGMGNWWTLLYRQEFKDVIPEGVDPAKGMWDNNRKNTLFFIWNDVNGDGLVQPEELQFSVEACTGITVLDDLSFAAACLNGEAIRFRPDWNTGTGRPFYDRDKGIVLATGVYRPRSSGGDQMLADDSDEAILTLGVEPFHSHSLSGIKNGKAVWSYPNMWPGLHPSHEASSPQFPGHVIGPTRLLGGFVHPKGSEVKPLWALNGNMGNIYLFTRDGLFVSTLFEDVRHGKLWRMLSASRNMPLENITLHDENFNPSIGQVNGQVYLVDGARSAVVRVDGLETLRPIPPIPVNVTAELLQKSLAYRQAVEFRRQKSDGTSILRIPSIPGMAIDGNFEKWNDVPLVEIDKRGVAANFQAGTKPYDITGRMAISGDRLLACWDTQLPQLLRNSGEIPTALFKTGGALDIMLGTNPAAKPDRRESVAGDLRLLVTIVDGKTRAMLYRPVSSSGGAVSGGAGLPTGTQVKVPFSSPWRTFIFDEVTDVSDHVQLSADKTGRYEISVPLAILGLKVTPGLRLSGDIGILRGQDNQTTARTYWSNKATAITSDVPSEAELVPALWGILEFK